MLFFWLPHMCHTCATHRIRVPICDKSSGKSLVSHPGSGHFVTITLPYCKITLAYSQTTLPYRAIRVGYIEDTKGAAPFVPPKVISLQIIFTKFVNFQNNYYLCTQDT